MIFRWLVGIIIGTALVAMTSPWFVRSYVPRVVDSTRDASILQPHRSYRWRSEGYATTLIGSMGMPGIPALSSNDADCFRIALWGDSQAEGICVDDDQKIAAFANRLSHGRCFVLPMARSGDDCNDWIGQIASIRRAADSDLDLDAHVFLVVEWSDWCLPIETPVPAIDETFNRICRTFPAFAIQAARNILTVGDTNQLRKLRFRPGPIPATPTPLPRETLSDSAADQQRLAQQLQRLRSETDLPCLFLYAPMVPAIIAGKVKREESESRQFSELAELCRENEFHIIDLRAAMIDSVDAGDWPRGFHHGQFGVGHYNGIGNEIIARRLVDFVKRIGSQD